MGKDEAGLGQHAKDGSSWTCTKCGGWSWSDRATCFKCGCPRWKKQGSGARSARGKAPTNITAGDFIPAGKGKQGRKDANQLQRKLARLEELEAKEAAGSLDAPELIVAAEDRHAEVTLEELERRIARFREWGYLDMVCKLQDEADQRRRKQKAAPTPGSCKAAVSKLKRLLDKALDAAKEAEQVKWEADQKVEKLAAELIEAERIQKEVAEQEYLDKVGASQPAKPMVKVAKIMEGDMDCFGFDFDGIFEVGETNVFTDEDSKEMQKREDAIKAQLGESVIAAFGQVCQNIRQATEEHKKEAQRMAQKRRKTEEGQSASDGAEGAGRTAATRETPGSGASQQPSNIAATAKAGDAKSPPADGKQGPGQEPAMVAADVGGTSASTSSAPAGDLEQRREAALQSARAKAEHQSK